MQHILFCDCPDALEDLPAPSARAPPCFRQGWSALAVVPLPWWAVGGGPSGSCLSVLDPLFLASCVYHQLGEREHQVTATVLSCLKQ